MKTIQVRIFLGLIGIFAFGLSHLSAQSLPNIKKVTDPIKNSGKKITNPIKDVRSTTKEITQPIKDVTTATKDVTRPITDTKREVEGLKNDVNQIPKDIDRAKSDINRTKDSVTPNKKKKDGDKDEDEDAVAAKKAKEDAAVAEQARIDSIAKSRRRKDVFVPAEEPKTVATGTSTGTTSRTVLLPPDNTVRRVRTVDNTSRGVVDPSLASADQPGYMRSPAKKSIDNVEFDMETLKDLFDAAIWTGPDSVHTARSIGFMLDELRRDISEVRQRDPEWDIALYEDRYRKWKGLYTRNTRPVDEF